MAMVVKNNMSAINALNTLNGNTSALAKSLKKVSSGMKITSAQDDASGYAISERMRVNIRGLDQANQNAQNGNSLLKVAEGSVSNTIEILRTLKQKAINAATDTNTDADRAVIQKELDQSIDQINDNANVTFNGKYLVDGSHNKKTSFTTTTMTNQNLNTATEADTELTKLRARNGDSLNIHSTDIVTVSYVQNGKTVTNTAEVGSCKLSEVIGTLSDSKVAVKQATTSFIGFDGSHNTVSTASGENAVTIASSKSGIGGQIAGFTIYITDNKGNVNKSANAVLDTFDESIRAQNASEDNSIVLQIGVKAAQSINVGMTDMRAVALGLQGDDGSTVSVGNQKKANAAVNVFDSAIQKALDQAATIGAAMSRLEYTSSNLTTASENVQSAESTIRDADMAKEMTEYTKNNVLMQAAQSMLSQANQSSSNALSLLQ